MNVYSDVIVGSHCLGINLYRVKNDVSSYVCSSTNLFCVFDLYRTSDAIDIIFIPFIVVVINLSTIFLYKYWSVLNRLGIETI